MIEYIEKLLKAIFVGDIGIKKITQGDAEIYAREGGYFYIKLDLGGK